MIVNVSLEINQSADSINNIILVKLSEPYKKVKKILSFSDVIIGENSNNYFSKYFRWSINNRDFSDFIPIDSNNYLLNLNLNPNSDLWIEFKYIAEISQNNYTLILEKINLQFDINSNKWDSIVQIPISACCNDKKPNCFNNLIIENCCDSNNIYKPYLWLHRANSIYDQLSYLASKIFGHCVKYYYVDPDIESEDVVLREYSIFNRSKVKNIQVLVPDNNFPSNEFQFDPFIGMGFEGFEIHIVRREFEEAFGLKARPKERDAIYFPINQRMYTVNSVALADEINAMHTYYKVKLRKFEDSKNIINTNEIETELNKLVTNVDEMFKEKTNDEILKITKPQEYKTIGVNNNDYIREKIIDTEIIIDEQINNNWTIVSKNYYDLSKIKYNTLAIKYRLKAELNQKDDLAFTFWFRSKSKLQKLPILISQFNNNNNYLEIQTSIQHNFSIGDYIELYNAGLYTNEIYKIQQVIDDYTIVLDVLYDVNKLPNSFTPQPKIQYKEHMPVLYGYNLQNPNNNGMSIDLFENYIIITINSIRYSIYLDLNNNEFDKNIWYSVVINLSNNFKQLSVYLYKLQKLLTYTIPQNEDSSLTKIKYKNIILNNTVQFNSNDNWMLLGSSIDLTNIRIFKKIIEEESHNAVLNQYVVRDTQYALLVDNALPPLRLVRFENTR